LRPLPASWDAAGAEGLGSVVTEGLAEGEVVACALFDGVADGPAVAE
jgi:hypothetical protein